MIILFCFLFSVSIIVLICFLTADSSDNILFSFSYGFMLCLLLACTTIIGVMTFRKTPEHVTVKDVSELRVDTTYVTTTISNVSVTDTIYTINYKTH